MTRFMTIGLALWLIAGMAPSAAAHDLTAKELGSARKIYVSKCAKCHRFYEPKRYSEADWKRWMESMSRKSKLKPDTERLLNRYLNAYRAGEVPSPTPKRR